MIAVVNYPMLVMVTMQTGPY